MSHPEFLDIQEFGISFCIKMIRKGTWLWVLGRSLVQNALKVP